MMTMFQDGDRVKLVVCPECGIVQALHDDTPDMPGAVFHCKICNREVKSLKVIRKLNLSNK